MKKDMSTARIFHVALWALFLALPAVVRAQDDRPDGAISFEMRAVADHAGPHTRSYVGLMAGADGKPENTLLMDPPLLDSKAIRYVAVDFNEEDHPFIVINLTENGAKKFEQVTKDMIGREVGLVIGGQLYSTPRIMEAIHGGKIAINGTFTAREAGNLAERLNAALPGRTAGR